MRHGPAEDVGIEHNDNSNDGTQSNRMPHHKTKNDSFVTDLFGGSGGNRNGLCIDHFSHDSAGAIGRAHKNRVNAELLGRNSLQASKQRVGGRIAAGKSNSQPAQEYAEKRIEPQCG